MTILRLMQSVGKNFNFMARAENKMIVPLLIITGNKNNNKTNGSWRLIDRFI